MRRATRSRKFQGKLIAVEGLDGSGKSTQIHLVKRWLELEGYKVFCTEWNSSLLVKQSTKKGKKRHLLTPTTFALIQGKLIVIEGADGSGRSTQISILRDWLERIGYPTVEIGLKRSTLVGRELQQAKQGNILSPLTFSLFYATDFADQLENIILPALRADFIVLADRYIYTLMARDIVRGVDMEWVKEVSGIALVPDTVFYLQVSPQELAERNFRKSGMLDYWESGMDIQRSGDMYDCFIRYQRQMQRLFHAMQTTYGFAIIDANQPPQVIAQELSAHIAQLLGLQPSEFELK